jgi:hypothetical protein
MNRGVKMITVAGTVSDAQTMAAAMCFLTCDRAAYGRYTLLDVPKARSAAFRNSLMSHKAIRLHSLAIVATS